MNIDIGKYSGNAFFWEFLRQVYGSLDKQVIRLLLGYFILVILIATFGNKKEIGYFVASLIILIACPFNPWVSWILVDKLGFTSRLFRVLWVIPVFFGYGYVFIKIYDWIEERFKGEGKRKVLRRLGGWTKYLLFVPALILLWMSFGTIKEKTKQLFTGYDTNDGMKPVSNIYKIEDDVIEAVDIINADAGDAPYTDKNTLFDRNMYNELRCYDASITNAYVIGRATVNKRYEQSELDNALSSGNYNRAMFIMYYSDNMLSYTQSDLMLAASRCDLDYVIMAKGYRNCTMWRSTMTELGETEHYYVLKTKKII